LVERKTDDSGPARAGCHSGNGEPRNARSDGVSKISTVTADRIARRSNFAGLGPAIGFG